VANGEALSYKQEYLRQLGHAIECRIYAEDPDNNFMPSPGLIRHITEPTGLGVRTDGYVYKGYEIPIYYDPMISKLIVWGRTRAGAIDRMKRALSEYKISGVKTSIRFLQNIMNNSDFMEGKYNTHFIEQHMQSLMAEKEKCDPHCEDIAIVTAFLDYIDKIAKTEATAPVIAENSGWKQYGRRNNLMRL